MKETSLQNYSKYLIGSKVIVVWCGMLANKCIFQGMKLTWVGLVSNKATLSNFQDGILPFVENNLSAFPLIVLNQI